MNRKLFLSTQFIIPFIILLTSHSGFGQIFFEDFSGNGLPAGWTIVDNTASGVQW